LKVTNQSGFRKQHSTETALIAVVDRLLENQDNAHANGMIFADFQTAFDLVDHSVLIEKLHIYDLDANATELMSSYLSGRKQATAVNGKLSSFQLLNHGVPQGSVLAPLLFLIFINDLPVGVIGQNTTVDIFANGTSMNSSAPISNIHTLRSNLNTSLQQLDNWSANNRVRLNTDKTKFMLSASKSLRNKLTEDEKLLNVKLENSTLEQVSTYKLLGITIDHELTFDDHVDSLCGKLAQRIGILRSIRSLLPQNERVLLYNTTIKSILMYSSSIWGIITSKQNLTKLLKLQKRAARVILNKNTRESRTVDLFKSLN